MGFRNIILLSVLSIQLACTPEDASNKSEKSMVEVPAPAIAVSDQWKTKAGFVILEWPDLAIPEYRPEFNQEIGEEVQIPFFRDEVRQLDGRLVEISGFFFPFEDDPQNPYYVLSQYPYSQCFFCGGAGPESVMDLLLKDKPRKLKMDDRVTFRGRLKLNDKDVMFLNYILQDAEWVENN